MFGQKNKETTFAPSPKAESTQIKTLISEGCKFEGNLYSPANTRIDGIVTGNLAGESGLIIGDKGVIQGDVSAVEVVVYGSVKGNIRANKLEVKGTGRIAGDVIVDHIVMEFGSKYNGNLRMNESRVDSQTEIYDLPEENK